MLTEAYIEALLVDEELADQVCEDLGISERQLRRWRDAIHPFLAGFHR